MMMQCPATMVSDQIIVNSTSHPLCKKHEHDKSQCERLVTGKQEESTFKHLNRRIHCIIIVDS